MARQTNPDTRGTRNVAGVELLEPDPNHDFSGFGGKKRFMNLSKDTEFTNYKELSQVVDQLPRVELADVGYSEDGHTDLDGYKVVRRADTKEAFDVASEQYTPVQYQDALHPLIEACQRYDLAVAGFHDVRKNGAQVSIQAAVLNPDFRIELLKEYDHSVALGVHVKASHDRSSAVQLNPFGVNLVCINHNLWGSFLPSANIRHTGDIEEKLDAVQGFFQRMLNEVPTLQERIQEANEVPLEREDVLYIGLDKMSFRHWKNWKDIHNRLEPLTREVGNTVYTTYQSLTAYYTHVHESDSQAVQERYLNKAGKVLDEEPTDIIERGRETAHELSEKREEQLADPDKRVTVPEVPGVIQ